MPSARGPTTIAIAAGAAIGALAALLAKGPAQPAPSPAIPTPLPPTASPSELATAPALPSGAPPASATVAIATPEAGPPEAGTAGAELEPKLDDVPAAQAELGCARRVPRSCLSAAAAYADGRGVGRDAAKARLYRSLAVSMYDAECTARDPEACRELAAIYASKIVAVPYPGAPEALLARTRELCQGKTSGFCGELGAK